MKRFLFIFLLLCIVCTSCSISKGSAVLSINCQRLGSEVLKVADDYLDGTITAIVAAGQIQDLCRQLSTVPDETGSKNQQLKNYCEILGYTLMRAANGDKYNEREIITTRNYLAALLGVEQRER